MKSNFHLGDALYLIWAFSGLYFMSDVVKLVDKKINIKKVLSVLPRLYFNLIFHTKYLFYFYFLNNINNKDKGKYICVKWYLS